MIRRSEYFEAADKYINNELTEPLLSEIELEIKFNSDLSDEINLQLEVQQAIQEQDIMNLRENLNRIAPKQVVTEKTNKFSFSDSYHFGLSEEISHSQNFSGLVNTEDISNLTHSIPKIHLYQHKMAEKENVYQFYKEQHGSDSSMEEELYSPMEDALFEDIKNALEESDVLDIRANLKQIAATLPDHSRSNEEIDNYVCNLMTSEQMAEFEEELEFNASLANDVKLFKDIDLASAENDIIELRSSLQQILNSELNHTSRIEEIEGYIYNELPETDLASFETELADNKELYAEIELVRNIDKAIQENDIMQLRDKLRNIANDNINEKQSERSITFNFNHKRIVLSVVAASLILLFGISGLLSKYSSERNIYQKFYAKYETTGISRSAENIQDPTLATALQLINNQNYESAQSLLQELLSKDQNNTVGHFYSGVTLQELGKYKNAIEQYEAVVINKDNLFIEQAEWYIGLCYLQTNDNKKAIKQFKKIANDNGFYQPKAVAILNKMKQIE